MPSFFHELGEARVLIETLAAEKGFAAAVVEKDYWITHCLWGLQRCGLRFEMKGGTSLSKGWGIVDRFSEDIDIRFDAPNALDLKSDKQVHVDARLSYYDDLAGRISIPGIQVERNRAFDDDKAQNGGISLKYVSHFSPLPGLRSEVLLEAGFAKTAPNEPRDFSSWIMDRAFEAGLEIADNRAPGVPCFNPEYTFVDKLQTIARRYRQHKSRRAADRDRPREFLRHYYDLYSLLGRTRVADFMATGAYDAYKAEKIRGLDAEAFASKEPFRLDDPETYQLFEREYSSMNTLLLSKGPSFAELVGRLREFADKF